MVKLGPVFLQQVRSECAVTHHTYCQSTYVVQRVYGQQCGLCTESQKAKTEIYFRHSCCDSWPNSSYYYVHQLIYLYDSVK